MNKHLNNIFQTYSREERGYQLENDLTRALAICLQEDALFFNEITSGLFKQKDETLFDSNFSSTDGSSLVQIEIQKKISSFEGEFDQVFAVALSESQVLDFWSHEDFGRHDRICDLTIKINDQLIIIEVKRDGVDCGEQLYNQVYNLFSTLYEGHEEAVLEMKKRTLFVDLNWMGLMQQAVKVSNIEHSIGSENRFVRDFINLIRTHNFRWLPESSYASLDKGNRSGLRRRMESAVTELCKTGNEKGIKDLAYSTRLGIEFPLPWAQEILFDVSKDGDLLISLYPGNTKSQGYSLFANNPVFAEELELGGNSYQLNQCYHIKFTSFQKYFAGLWFNDSDLKEGAPLYTSDNFNKYTGRKKRPQWEEVWSLFDDSFMDKYEWKNRDEFNLKSLEESGRSQFDMSFGYELAIHVSYKDLAALDKDPNDLSGLVGLLEGVYDQLTTNALISNK